MRQKTGYLGKPVLLTSLGQRCVCKWVGGGGGGAGMANCYNLLWSWLFKRPIMNLAFLSKKVEIVGFLKKTMR